jgi:hypothetical protein
MLKNIGSVLIGLFVLSVTSQAQGETAARTKDIYTIYSALIPAAQTLYANPVYLIHPTTAVVPVDGMQRLGFGIDRCVRVPPDYAASWAEVLTEARSGNITAGPLQPEFNLSKPYVLLGRTEVPPNVSTNTSDTFHLSVVYFNRNRTLALTSVGTNCGTLCGTGRWAPFEKLADGTWVERREWVRCVTIA